MPYRALIWTIVTVGLTLAAVGMWARAIEPMMSSISGRDQPATQLASAATSSAFAPVPPVTLMRRLVQGTMLLSFLLICLVMIVGLAATFREWVRYRAHEFHGGRGRKTAYIDAWKIAGERMKAETEEKENEEGG